MRCLLAVTFCQYTHIWIADIIKCHKDKLERKSEKKIHNTNQIVHQFNFDP